MNASGEGQLIYAVRYRLGDIVIESVRVTSDTAKQLRVAERKAAFGFKFVLDKTHDARCIAYSKFDALQNFLRLENIVMERATREIESCKRRIADAERLLTDKEIISGK